jgi:hypothetical protein
LPPLPQTKRRRPQVMTKLNSSLISFAATSLVAATAAFAQPAALPDPTSPEFCVAVQKIIANTDIEGTNEIFDNMPDYRHSKPSPNPLLIYQVVTYDEVGPIVVSCKVKSSDHLLAEYGEDAAGEQLTCPVVTELVKQQAVAELGSNAEAKAVAEGFVIDATEPSLTGQAYLSDFQPSYTAEDGTVHFNTPGLQSDYEGLMSWVMPDRFIGQTYCHLPTADYMKRIARGEVEPGATLTTADDAPVTPPGS